MCFDVDQPARSHEAAEKLISLSSAALRWREERRSSTGRKAGEGLQKFLVTISSFVESFTGIAELMKAADSQYGGLAYGTVSLLLSVAVHKQRREEAIEEALEELTYAFPRLATLQELEPSFTLKGPIARSFALVVQFCRESIAYYADRWQRMKGAFSPAAHSMKPLAELRRVLAQAREETDLMLSKSIHDMQHRLRRTQELVEESSEASKESNLARVSRVLFVDDTLPDLDPRTGTDTDSEQYGKLLLCAFDMQGYQQEQRCQPTWEMFTQEHEFSHWLRSRSSRFLLCGGVNPNEGSIGQCGTLNWLSRASLDTVQYLQNQGESVIFFYCQTDWSLSTATRHSFQHVVNSLAYRLAGCYHGLLPSRLEKLESTARATVECGGQVRVVAALKPLRLLFSALSEDIKVNIIIDRLDQCKWEVNDTDTVIRFQDGIEGLLELMRIVKCCVKILLVVESFRAEKLFNRELSKKDRDQIGCKLRWEQETEDERLLRVIRREMSS